MVCFSFFFQIFLFNFIISKKLLFHGQLQENAALDPFHLEEEYVCGQAQWKHFFTKQDFVLQLIFLPLREHGPFFTINTKQFFQKDLKITDQMEVKIQM